MKKIFALVLPLLLVVSLSAFAQSAAPTGAVADVLRMAAAGVGDDVLLAYVQGSASTFPLTVDQIIQLKSAKVGSPVIQAMINHVPTASAQTSTPAPTAAAPATPAPTPSPDPNVMPAPLVEYVPLAPGPGYRWAPGYWTWAAGGWVWISGQWQPTVYVYSRPFYPRLLYYHRW
jgi:hypothetical protein